MQKRILSPSSINLYKQCPRRYYHQYIEKLKTAPNIHAVRGNVIHAVLERFFDMELTGMDLKNFEHSCRRRLQALLKYCWEKNSDIQKLALSEDQLLFYFGDSLFMLLNWFNKFNERIKTSLAPDIATAFKQMIPEREHFIQSDELSARGYIDAVETSPDKKIRLMDYKTSKSFEITSEYKLQLAIYALLYTIKFGHPPSEVGIYFLKDPNKHEYSLKVDGDLLSYAKSEIEAAHLNTEPDNITAYPKKPGPLCKFSSGQCDFYEMCFKKN